MTQFAAPVAFALAGALAVLSVGPANAAATTRGALTANSENALVNRDAEALALGCPNAIVQKFPTTGATRTKWRICWHEVAGNNSIDDPNGLVIGPVYFSPEPGTPLILILAELRMSDIFVPYHSGSPRFYDLSGFNFRLTGVNANDCPASVGGTLLSNHVCQEVHDRGLMWKDFSGVRRGEQITLWGAIDSANYRYIQEYTFRDDGVITARIGATGQNLPGDELETHAHSGVWRIDMDLGGSVNTFAHMQHLEDPQDGSGAANDTFTTLTTEGAFEYSVRTHDALQIVNPAVLNKEGHPISYMLMPIDTGGGLTQHRENFTQNDFWVTRYHGSQYAARRLPKYISNGETLTGEDAVAWFKASLHHMPRDEDGIYSPNWIGTTHVMWSGFMLVPHDLFDCSPFYQTNCPK